MGAWAVHNKESAMSRIRLVLAAVGSLIFILPLPGQQRKPVAEATVHEVLLDFVVHKRNGRIVRDLRPEEIEVFENGEQQQIRSFRLVSGREAIVRRPPAAPGKTSIPGGETRETLEPLRQVRLVCLTFDRLDPDGRRFARKAALDLIQRDDAGNVYYAVMALGGSLHILQGFTRDRALLRTAIESATAGVASLKADAVIGQREVPLIEHEGMDHEDIFAGSAGVGLAALHIRHAVADLFQYAREIEKQHEGHLIISALAAMVRALGELPGRKTILYFSHGFQLQENVSPRFRALVDSANRNHVAFYALDATGLRSAALTTANTRLLQKSAAESRSVMLEDSGGKMLGGKSAAGAGSRNMKIADTVVDSIRASARANLGTLAGETGGYLVADTNDFRRPARRILAQIYSYYELSYRPTNRDFDGTYRKIEIRVARKKAVVQSRDGYFAIPAKYAEGYSPFEVPLLLAMDRRPAPEAFGFRAAALRFEPENNGARYVVDVEIPLANLTLEPEQNGALSGGGLTLVSVIRNARGGVVRKFSRWIPLHVPAEKLDAFRAGNFTFTEQLSLAAGHYTMETAVDDQASGRRSVKRSVLVVPKATPTVQMSDVVLVRRIELVSASADVSSADPLHIGPRKVTPSLSGIVRRGIADQASLYFVVYSGAGAKDSPKVLIEIEREGEMIARTRPKLPAPDSIGRIPYIASVPLTKLLPGSYEVRVLATQSGVGVEKRTTLQVQQGPSADARK